MLGSTEKHNLNSDIIERVVGIQPDIDLPDFQRVGEAKGFPSEIQREVFKKVGITGWLGGH
jgi:hypothetical protein